MSWAKIVEHPKLGEALIREVYQDEMLKLSISVQIGSTLASFTYSAQNQCSEKENQLLDSIWEQFGHGYDNPKDTLAGFKLVEAGQFGTVLLTKDGNEFVMTVYDEDRLPHGANPYLVASVMLSEEEFEKSDPSVIESLLKFSTFEEEVD